VCVRREIRPAGATVLGTAAGNVQGRKIHLDADKVVDSGFPRFFAKMAVFRHSFAGATRESQEIRHLARVDLPGIKKPAGETAGGPIPTIGTV
jgi:hypothetical protein